MLEFLVEKRPGHPGHEDGFRHTAPRMSPDADTARSPSIPCCVRFYTFDNFVIGEIKSFAANAALASRKIRGPRTITF
jgi:chromosomal replication initiation ATPase DnaA